MTKTEARATLRTTLDNLDLDNLKSLAVRAFKVATPISGWTFGVIMDVLASRHDRRSFVNICEDIHRDCEAV